MKKNFEPATLELIKMSAADVVAASTSKEDNWGKEDWDNA